MIKIPVFKGVVQLLESIGEVKEYFSKCEEDKLLAFDWETTGLEYDAIPLGLSLHQKGVGACFIPVDFFFSKGVPMNELAEVCNERFPHYKLIAHNAKYDTMINKMNGIKDECYKIFADTLVMVHLVNPSLDKQLEKRVAEDFGYVKKTFKEICGKAWNKINWSVEGDSLLELLAGYAGEDTYWTTKVFYKYNPLMDEDAHRIHDRIELPLIPILRDAKIRGVLIDVPLLKEMGEQITAELPKILDEVYDECGCVFNLNSAKQKAAVFFDKMKLPIVSYSKKTGAPSTDAATFEEWDSMGIRVGALMNEYSELNKLYTGYVKAIPNLVDEHSVLRGDLNSCGTKTGRFASTGPNLQNQPNNYHFPIREAFVPRPGYKFVNYDYSQLELRVMAHMSKDERFMDIFLHGRDPHGEVAKACNITRKQAKVMNFGVLYGMGIGKYMRTFNVAKERAIEMIDNYHKSYIGFAHWKEATENFARKHGYVKNLFGRIRVFKETTKSKFTRNEAMYYAELRQAVNCVDTETEIFTKRGWLHYDEVHEGDIALTYNGDKDVMEWQPIMEVVRMPYVGNMISMEGDTHNSLSTPNHRWFVRDNSSGPCVTRDSEFILDMSKKGSYRFPLCANIMGEDNSDFSDEWLELFGVFITDGFHESLHQIGICQSSSCRKKGNIERIQYLIEKVGDEIVRERNHSWGKYDACHYWTLRGEFTEWCKVVTNQKKRIMDMSWVYSLSQRQANKLLDGIILGDGFKSRNCKTTYIGNIHKYMVDFYSEVAILSGKSYGISIPSRDSKNRDYVISIKSRRNVYCGLLKRRKVHYNGIVWCPRVENQSFLMRRNGKVCITRNTIIQGTGADIVKLATIAMCRKFKELNLDAHFLLQVHDEVLIEVREDQMMECERVVIDCMENTVKLDVPLIADGKILANWGEMKNDDIVSYPYRFNYGLVMGVL